MFKGIKNYLYLVLSQYKSFWVLKEKNTNLIFKAKTGLFSFKNFIENSKETYFTYKTFRNWSIIRIFLIILMTFLLQVINPIFEITIKAILHYITPTFVSFKLNSITDSEYITFLGAIATLGGVFIALYFSTLSAINATLYNTFSNNLRDLLYRESSEIHILNFYLIQLFLHLL